MVGFQGSEGGSKGTVLKGFNRKFCALKRRNYQIIANNYALNIICAKFLIAQKNEVVVDNVMGFQSIPFGFLRTNPDLFLVSRSFFLKNRRIWA